MLRITLNDSDDVVAMKLEGCVAGPSVSEAFACWQRVTNTLGGRRRPVHVDLRGVCHVDDEGRKLLMLMYLAGAEFLTSGCVMPEVVREISEAAQASYSFVWRN